MTLKSGSTNVVYCEKSGHADDHSKEHDGHAHSSGAHGHDDAHGGGHAHGDAHHGDEHKHGSFTSLYPIAFPEHVKQVPLTPKQDEELGYKTYKWGYEPIPLSRTTGGRYHDDPLDQRNHQVENVPWPHEKRAYHGNEHPSLDRINQQYDNMLSDYYPLSGYSGKPTFGSNWEKLLAYHHQIYKPEKYQEVKTADDIRLSVSDFVDRVNADNPKDMCKYLVIENFRCRQVYQETIDPTGAAKNCYKWERQLQQCQWDAEKMTKGHTYIEQRGGRHRKYLFAPEYRYA